MGIYDREYYRDEPRSGLLGDRTMVTNLIILSVAVYLIDLITGGVTKESFGDWLQLDPNLLQRPWQAWQLVTYGFVHDPRTITHVLFNMFVLWMFGREIEQILGRMEFLRVYLTAIVLSGLTWVIFETIKQGPSSGAPLIGASGGVYAIMILWILNFPKRTILFMMFLPMPAWVLGVFYIVADVIGIFGSPVAGNQPGEALTAHAAHLAGAAFGFLYFRNHWNLGRFVPARLSLSSFRLRPRLRVHDPEQERRDLGRQVDRILEKISQEGEASLTPKERKTLEKASRRYQQRRE